MIIAKCSACGKKYRIPRDRLPEGKKVSFSCPKCKARIVLDLRKRQTDDPYSKLDSPPPTEKESERSHSGAVTTASPDDGEKLRQNIENSIQDLPFMPQVVIKAQKAIADPKTESKQLARILQTDPAIVTAMLKIANSAYYGLSGTVSSIENACVILGYQIVKELILTTGVSNLLGRKLKGYGFDSGELWMHSLAAGIASKMIADRVNPELSENAYLSGLLHDAGKIILDPYVFERKETFEQLVENGNHNNFEAEKRLLGFDHAEIASKICNKWHIPEEITMAIRNHHQPSASADHTLSYMVHTGDYVARLCGLGYEADDILYEAEEGSIERLGLDRQILGEMMLPVLEAIRHIDRAIKS